VRPVRILVLFAALLSFGAIPSSPAMATTVEDCQGELATLTNNTKAAQNLFTNPKDFEGLVGKLDAASTYLAVGKNQDAVKKLGDFQTKLDSLATADKPKVDDPEVAQALIAEADGVIECINQIGM
jgi:hypothetical protein